jgi:hypothetical protein
MKSNFTNQKSFRFIITRKYTQNMQITKTSKVVAAVVGFALALTVFAAVGSSVAQAQSMTLTQLIDLFISLGIISPEKAAAAKAAAGVNATATFTRDLTIGSSGADVSALQARIGVSPATGYFGSITKSAVMAYQAAHNVPATGYVGPLTRASLNASATGTVNSTTGTSGTGVVNTGVEGTIAVSQSNSGVRSTVYEGEKMVPILGFELEAKSSDISFQRVKLNLGNTTKIYNKIYDTIYLTDGSTVLAQADLNSNTVVKDGANYFITLAGFNSTIARNAKKTYQIKVDVRPSIDTADQTSYTVSLATTQPIRGVDQAGIDQYAGDNTISRSVTVSGSLTESATLTASTNTNTPKKASVIASEGTSDNELDKVEVLKADFKAEKDDVTITDLVVDVTKTGTGGATASSTVYLFDGATEIDSASVSSNSATFSDVDVLVAKGTTKTLTIKVDIRNANGTVSLIAADIDTADITAENTAGDTVTATGSAQGETQYVQNVGALVTLVSKSIVTSGAPQNNGVSTNVSTSTLTASFTVKVKAVGNALQFGTTASGTPMFTTTGSNPSFKVYRGGVADTTLSSYSTSTDWAIPAGVTTTGLTNSWSLAEGSEVTVPVTFSIQGRSATAALTSGLYSVGLESIQPNAPYAVTFMAGEADWRTSSVSFP